MSSPRPLLLPHTRALEQTSTNPESTRDDPILTSCHWTGRRRPCTPRRSHAICFLGRWPDAPRLHHDVGDYRLDVRHVSRTVRASEGRRRDDRPRRRRRARPQRERRSPTVSPLRRRRQAASPCPRCRSSPSPTDAPTAPPRLIERFSAGTPSSLL
ncbi:hypothetical protein IOD13_00075 [Brevibacterium casei]|nr:hypothetical protein [Brevibacterium casei]